MKVAGVLLSRRQGCEAQFFPDSDFALIVCFITAANRGVARAKGLEYKEKVTAGMF